jgi:hypothetical protein
MLVNFFFICLYLAKGDVTFAERNNKKETFHFFIIIPIFMIYVFIRK